MSATPLSDLIQSFHEARGGEDFEAMLALFLTSQIGIHAVNVPQGLQGQTVISKGEGIGLANTTHGDGKKRIVAFADPQEFIKRFGAKCNGEMLGGELIKVALHNTDCHGVLLNSARSEISTLLSRSVLEGLLEPSARETETQGNPVSSNLNGKKWWKFWQ
jgi:hypothetical protein